MRIPRSQAEKRAAWRRSNARRDEREKHNPRGNERVNVWVPKRMKARLMLIASRRNTSMGELVKRLIAQELGGWTRDKNGIWAKTGPYKE